MRDVPTHPPGEPQLVFGHPHEDQANPRIARLRKMLPRTVPIFLEGEKPSSLRGLLVTDSPQLQAFEQALDTVIHSETAAQLALRCRTTFDASAHRSSWSRYREILHQVLNSISSSASGQDLPGAFWLFHSAAIAQRVRSIPRQILAEKPEVGRRGASELKYSVLQRLLERIWQQVDSEEVDTDQHSGEKDSGWLLLSEMTDNVLIFSEVHLDFNLAELQTFLDGYLHEDATAFRQRWTRLREWLVEEVVADREMQALQQLLLGRGVDPTPDRLLTLSGFPTFLEQLARYDHAKLLSHDQIELWESVLERLKIFELLCAARRQAVRVHWKDGKLCCDAREVHRIGGDNKALTLARSARPLDFMSPGVIDPSVERSGLIYDLIDFSRLLAESSRDPVSDESTFRALVLLQQRIDRIASHHRLYREKYLGDGALYTGRDPRSLCIAAVELQRCYQRAVSEGFPINAGVRIALNHGNYRLLRLRGIREGEEEHYEVFGQSIIELSRLTSGKANLDLEEIKVELIAQGCNEAKINDLLEPLLRDKIDRRGDMALPSSVRLTQGGQLENEGIVTTAEFLRTLQTTLDEAPFYRLDLHGRSFVVVHLEEGSLTFDIGFRRLGRANLKGLDDLTVYEMVDAGRIDGLAMERVKNDGLMETIDRLFSAVLTSSI